MHFGLETAIGKTASKDKPATDVQAALTVIGRRVKGPGAGPNLANASIPEAILSHANLSGANLRDTNLSGADLRRSSGLTQTQLAEACGDANTKPPEGRTSRAREASPTACIIDSQSVKSAEKGGPTLILTGSMQAN